MTKPLIYLLLLFGGAIATGAGVLTYGEWRDWRQPQPDVAAAPADSAAAPSEAAPAGAPPATAEERLATPPAGSPALAPPVAQEPAERRDEAAAVPPPGQRAVEAPLTPPPALSEAAPPGSPERALAPSAPSVAAEAAPAGPAFDIVRVEPTGEAVIAGSAPRGATVQVLSNGEVVAETRADDGGNWVALPDRPLLPGSHDLTIRALSASGEATESEQRVAIAVPERAGEEVVAVLDTPGQASEILAGPGRAPRAAAQPPQKLERLATATDMDAAGAGVLSVDAVEAEGRTLFVAGAGDPGALVRVYVDGDLVGEARAGAGGRWLVEAARALEEGEVTVRVDQLKAGTAQVEARAEVPFMRRLDMASLVPSARAGAGAGDSAEGDGLPQPGAVIIRRGDNLWSISRRTYGRGVRYTTIYRANEDQIRDPHWIYPGQVFMLPTGDRAWSGD